VVDVKLTVDLHDIYNKGGQIDKALEDVIHDAAAKKVKLVEIIPGKGSGQLKKHVLRFLEKNRPPAKHVRIEKDSKNFGRIFVHLRW
jgi:DNA-nicking Smr family endonuclease